MRLAPAAVLAITFGLGLALVTEARAVSPRNPYRSFNLSGLNYGSMQWEKAQRQGKRGSPSSSRPSGSGIVAGGGGGSGMVIQSGGSTRSPRSTRGLFRRR